MIIDEHQPLTYVTTCLHCRGTGECRHPGMDGSPITEWCCECGGSGEAYIDIDWIRALTSCLALAGYGAACERRGYDTGWDAAVEECERQDRERML